MFGGKYRSLEAAVQMLQIQVDRILERERVRECDHCLCRPHSYRPYEGYIPIPTGFERKDCCKCGTDRLVETKGKE